MTYQAEAVQQLVIDGNDPGAQVAGNKLAQALMEKKGPATALSILVSAVHQSMVAVLHAETPMPEANVSEIRRLLAALTENVMRHESCAMEINGAGKKGIVH